MAQHQPAIHSVEMVLRENLYGFQGNQKSPYLKITVTDPKHINKLRTSIERGDANFKGYSSGNEEPGKGFGHIAVSCDDVEAACARFEQLGVTFQKRPSDGKMRHIAFIKDPDG